MRPRCKPESRFRWLGGKRPLQRRRSMKCPLWLAFLLASLAGVAAMPRNDGREWRTLHGDLQRSGFYPSFPPGKLRLAWRKELWSELTAPRAEVIVGGGLAFMGTYA